MYTSRPGIIIFIAMLLPFISCKPKATEGRVENQPTTVAQDIIPADKTDPILAKYRNQERPDGYTGILMYDLLALLDTTELAMVTLLTRTNQWEFVQEEDQVILHNKHYDQFLTRMSKNELFIIDYSPYHLMNVNYLKENGYFNYADSTLGNSYFTCDSIFVTWRMNDKDKKGGSSMLLFNIE